MAIKKTYTLAELATYLHAELKGDSSRVIHRLSPLQAAKDGDLSFLDNPRYARYLSDTKATAVIISSDQLSKCPVDALIVSNPYLAYAKVAALFDKTPTTSAGIHQTALIDPSSKIHESASIGPYCVIGPGVEIEKDVILGPGCVINNDCRIGEGTRLFANVTIYHNVKIGKACYIHAGVVLGSDGFGLVKENGQWERIAQLGGITIGDRVDIGANTTIDRGALNDTIIGNGVKIDNQVQIGHNVRVGSHTAIAGCTGIAGSAEIGKHCVIGGAVDINGHIQIADNVMIAGASTVANSIKNPGVYSSMTNIQPHHQWRKNLVRLHQLNDMAKRILALEKSLGHSMQPEANQEE